MTSLTLNDLNFTDLYVRLDQKGGALYLPRERGRFRHTKDVPPEFIPVVERVVEKCNKDLVDPDGAMEFDGIRCRISRQNLADDTVWACLRRINTDIPEVEKLGFFPPLAASMRSLGARDGLILISGATGAGKTTTAVALLADYLRRYGGTAVTIEDPVEYVMKGRHGEGGYCFQVEVDSEEDWAINLKRALRWAPRYIFVGEIRTPKAAEQLLRAATTGHTVIATVHAGALEEALMGLIFLAEQSMGPGVESILAAGLTAVIYQRMRDTGPDIRYVYTEENAPGDPVRSIIREKKIGMITTYVDKAAAKLAQAPPGGLQASAKASAPVMPPPVKRS